MIKKCYGSLNKCLTLETNFLTNFSGWGLSFSMIGI